jgi:hypothetical protein
MKVNDFCLNQQRRQLEDFTILLRYDPKTLWVQIDNVNEVEKKICN